MGAFVLLGVLPLELGGDHRHLGQCLRHTHAGTQAAHSFQPIVVAVAIVVRLQPDGGPQLDVAVGEVERARHHSDNGVAFVIEQHLAAQNLRIAPEAPLPQSVAEKQRAAGAFAIIGRRENASQERLHLQRGQHVAVDQGDVDAHRLAFAHQIHGVAVVRSHRREGVAHLFPIGIVGRRKLQARVARLGLPQLHELLGMGERQGPQKNLVGERKGGGVGADAESYHQHGRGGESGSAPQGSRGVTQILPQYVGMDCQRVKEDFEEDADPQRRKSHGRGVAQAARQDAAHFAGVLVAKGSGVKMEQQTIEPHYALTEANPLARAMRTSSWRRLVSARATLVPKGVMR